LGPLIILFKAVGLCVFYLETRANRHHYKIASNADQSIISNNNIYFKRDAAKKSAAGNLAFLLLLFVLFATPPSSLVQLQSLLFKISIVPFFFQ
jgi:hypothetical protein